MHVLCPQKKSRGVGQSGLPRGRQWSESTIGEVHFLDYPDKEINEVGARGIGEIGLAGIAAAITAAVHHATGVRVRELPVRIEDLLA